MKTITKIFIFFGLLLTLAIAAQAANASSFTPGYIISDADFTFKDSMSKARIQSFLEGKDSYLASYTTDGLTAAEIIYNASQTYSISPRVILIRLQVEQSLITAKNPSQRALDWATGYGVCDNCSIDDPRIQQYKGFLNQINWCAKQNRRYLDYPNNYNFRANKEVTVDDQTFTIVNQATAALYNYTPHLHGAELFKYFLDLWFDVPYYPDGSLLREAGTPGVYLIENGKKRAITSQSALYANYDPDNIIEVSRDVLDQYEDGAIIKWVDNMLIRSPKGTVYLISGGKKRGFASRDALRELGYNPEEIIDTSWAELNKIPNGKKITIQESFPAGALLQGIGSPGVFYLDPNGILHPIWDRTIMEINFPNRKPIQIDKDDLKKFKTGDPLKFKDGTLITSKSSKAVYVISNGQRRAFKSAAVFNALGYKWENIIYVKDKVLKLHSKGKTIKL